MASFLHACLATRGAAKSLGVQAVAVTLQLPELLYQPVHGHGLGPLNRQAVGAAQDALHIHTRTLKGRNLASWVQRGGGLTGGEVSEGG